ncbi:MAG: hypothetical protein HN826_04260 [Methylococcales bacterium]|nr:hypothetical protein [Methylococcales bacterium]
MAIIPHTAVNAGAFDELKIQTTTVNTQDSNKVGIDESKGELKNMFMQQKKLVVHILERIGITKDQLSPSTLQKINTMQTNSIDAFYSFSKGLDFLDKGDYDNAQSSFEEAAKLDPSFQMATNYRDAMPEIMTKEGVKTASTSTGKSLAKKLAAKESNDALVTAKDKPRNEPVVKPQSTPPPVEKENNVKKESKSQDKNRVATEKNKDKEDKSINELSNDTTQISTGSDPDIISNTAFTPFTKRTNLTLSTGEVFTSFFVVKGGRLVMNPYITNKGVNDTSRITINQLNDGGFANIFTKVVDGTDEMTLFGFKESVSGIKSEDLKIKFGINNNLSFSLKYNGAEIAKAKVVTLPDFLINGNKIHVHGAGSIGLIASITAKPISSTELANLISNNGNVSYTYNFQNGNDGNPVKGNVTGMIINDNNGTITEYGVLSKDSIANAQINFGSSTGHLHVLSQGKSFAGEFAFAQVVVDGSLDSNGLFNSTSPETTKTGIGSISSISNVTTVENNTVQSEHQTSNVNVTAQVVGAKGEGVVGVYTIQRANGSDGNWAASGAFGMTCSSTTGQQGCP